MVRLPLFVIFVTVVFSCSSNIDFDEVLNFTKNEVIEANLTQNQVFYIDLDSVERIRIEPGVWEFLDETIANPRSVARCNDRYYVADYLNHRILVFDSSRTFIAAKGQYGQGPADFKEPIDITCNKDHIAIYEAGNLRIQIFDSEFNWIKSINGQPNLGIRNLDTCDSDILISNRGSTNPQYLHELHSFQKVDKEVEPLIKSLYNQGHKLQVMNRSIASFDEKCDIYFAYTTYPIVFGPEKTYVIFNDFIKENIHQDISGSENIQLRRFINDISVKGNYLFVLSLGHIYIIDIKKNTLLESLQLLLPESVSGLTVMKTTESEILLTSHFPNNLILTINIEDIL